MIDSAGRDFLLESGTDGMRDMASSQIKSEHAPGPGPMGAFPFAWSNPAIPVSETVITSNRSEALIAVPVPVDREATPELMRRLFPTSLEVDESQGIRLGHFTIQRRIGVGGMGSVFLAMDEQLRRNVALKVLSPFLTTDPAAVLRFQNEARAAARLDHDNIARIFFYGDDNGLHYIAYEYIPGSNLRDVIRSKEKLAPAEAVNYTMQLAAALSHTSAAGVIHRDIKPSNVLITPQGRAKLVDLGLARKESADTSVELTVAGTTLGTFDYISPEQAKDPRSVDVRSDIYSLGCTLYHMLTGEPPYPDGTVLQKLLDHQGKEPPDPMRKNRRVPPELSAIVRKMMASEPRRRYSNPARLLSDLLKVARMLGAGAVPIDGQVWLTATRADHPTRPGNIGWIATAAALLFLVIAMERFPGLTRRLDPRAVMGGPQAGLKVGSMADSTTGSSNGVGHGSVEPGTTDTGGRLPGSTAASPTTPTPTELPKPSTLAGNVVSPVHPAAVGTLPPIPKADPVRPPGSPIGSSTGSPPKVGNDGTDLVSSPMPEKNKVPPSLNPLPGKDPLVETAVNPQSAGNPHPANTTTALGPAGLSNAADPQRPVITIVGGKSYASLEAACSEAKDGTIIELRYNGRRGRAETPIRLTNKENVIIRNGIGFRPTIEFAPGEPPTDAESRMMTVTGGSLQLVNVDVLLTVPERIAADRWAVFSLERPHELQLQDVTVTVVNPVGQPACVIEQKAAPGQGVGNMGIMKNGLPVEPPRVGIFNSFFRGQCDLILLRDAVSARFQLKDAVVALQGALLHANCQSEMNNAENDRVWLDLDSTTCLTTDGLVLTEGVNQLEDHTPPLTVTTRDNIFWCLPNRPLVAMMDAGDLMEMQRRFMWTGERNHYDSVVVFWQLGGHQGPSPARQLDFDAWRSYWGAGEGTGSVNTPVKWRVKPGDQNWAKVAASSVELDAAPSTNFTNRIQGATLGKLPPVPTDRPAAVGTAPVVPSAVPPAAGSPIVVVPDVEPESD